MTCQEMMKCCWLAYLTVMYDAEKIGKLTLKNLKSNNDYALWLKVSEKADKLADSVVLGAIEEELTGFYGLPRKGGIWSRQRQNFVDYLGRCEGGSDGVKFASEEVCEAIIDELT